MAVPEYSNSQLGKFESCPLQYRLIYVDRIKRPEEGVEAFLGQRFHEAMEGYTGSSLPKQAELDEDR